MMWIVNVIIRPHALVKSDKPGAQEKILDDLLGQLKDEKLSIWSKSKGSQLNHGDFNLSEDMKKKIESEFNIQVRKTESGRSKSCFSPVMESVKAQSD